MLLRNIDCANISSEDYQNLVERVQEMNRREILKKHKSPIGQIPSSGYWYTRLDGKLVKRNSKEALEEAIVKFYQEDSITLCSVFPQYLIRRKIEVSSRTWSKDIRYFEQFLKSSALGKKPINSITLDDGYGFIEHCLSLKGDMKQKYWSNINGFLNGLFNYCIQEHLIDDNPFIHLKPRRGLFKPNSFVRDGDTVFSRAEQKQVIDEARIDAIKQNSAIPLGIVLLFFLGLRDGELCALKWGDIEDGIDGRKYIHIQRELVADISDEGKSNGYKIEYHCKTPAGNRRLILNHSACEILRDIKTLNTENGFNTGIDDFVFQREYKGIVSYCSTRSFDSRLRKYCKKVGMEVIKSPHDVRRTVLTNLYLAHMPLNKIQEFAGHSSLKQTLDYLRVTDDEIDMLQYLDTLSNESLDGVINFQMRA